MNGARSRAGRPIDDFPGARAHAGCVHSPPGFPPFVTFRRAVPTIFGLLIATVTPLSAQVLPVADPVLDRIQEIGIGGSMVEAIAQPLLDSIGPRLTGSPGIDRASDWTVSLVESWGVEARKEQYGTWLGWERGITHVDLLEPRVRALEATLLAWSPGTDGPVDGLVDIVPAYQTPGELDEWLATVAGKFIAISFPQPACRSDDDFLVYGGADALDQLRREREQGAQEFLARVPSATLMRARLEEAGAAGVLETNWPGGPGVTRVHSTTSVRAPTIALGCEDYGLLWRLAENGQGPRIRVSAQARFLGEVPVYNTIAVIPGAELPDEYVVLSAHFDSWDAASGATDNGTGVTVMLEALRILKEAYPQPRRTILLGLWGGEEQGLNGSRRFAAMHPEVVEGLQALFNQDTGTGRVSAISAQGLLGAGEQLAKWISRVPESLRQDVDLLIPGLPSSGTSDHAAFVCSGAPGFHLTSVDWGYGVYTWHTDRDTFDKIVFEEVRDNAVLVAMLAYLAAEDPERVTRERRQLPSGSEGQTGEWPACQPGQVGW